jgi:hypothetical protein
MHVNNVFLFFKIYFWYQHIKTIQNIQIILNFNKKKSKFLEIQSQPRSFYEIAVAAPFINSYHNQLLI